MTTGGESIKSTTGKARIKKQGHTSSGAFGSSTTKQPRFGKTVTEIPAK